MLTCDTMDTRECVQQTLDLVKVGCEIVRITAPTVKDAANLKNIKAELAAAGCDVPIVADIHFKPDAAMEAAQWVEKVRVNPGNFADKKSSPCANTPTTVRRGTRADRRDLQAAGRFVQGARDRHAHRHEPRLAFGPDHEPFRDTPAGMVESAVEFARIARKYGYHDFIFSMKSSNPKVMINAYRLLAARLLELGPDWNYPLHLGVTEAGDGEDGRIKSAIGIGALLADGIGDTVRVSLTEDSVHEIPVARALVALAGRHAKDELPPQQPPLSFDPFLFARRASESIALGEGSVGGPATSTRVGTTLNTFQAIEHKRVQLGDLFPDFVVEKESIIEVDPRDGKALEFLAASPDAHLVTIKDGCTLSPIVATAISPRRFPPSTRSCSRTRSSRPPSARRPTCSTPCSAPRRTSARCSATASATAFSCAANRVPRQRPARLQHPAIGRQPHFKTDYVACPSCGRTLFNLQATTAKIRAVTNHLKGVKIAIMGCIVNGPGEMADADFGYVGGAPGKVNLYISKTPVKFNIPRRGGRPPRRPDQGKRQVGRRAGAGCGGLSSMPRKLRELVADLERAGWREISGGKGSHRKFAHPLRPAG